MRTVNYTREPLVESVITPKEGCKLVVRCSSGVGQEDYFVEDSLFSKQKTFCILK